MLIVSIMRGLHYLCSQSGFGPKEAGCICMHASGAILIDSLLCVMQSICIFCGVQHVQLPRLWAVFCQLLTPSAEDLHDVTAGARTV